MIKTTGLEEEFRKINSLGDTFDKEIIKELNELGLDWRDDARLNINRVSGDLARSTNLRKAEKYGKVFAVAVINNLEYAEHYEFGHRQEVGRYVPALGKTLKKPYVKGQYTFLKARQKAKVRVPKAVKNAIKRAEDKLNG